MSYPNQGQPGDGTPQQAYGVPAQQPYGEGTQPAYGAPGQPTSGAPGQPAYGAPGQPTSGAPGQPAYGAPQYGAPQYGAPGQAPYGAPQPQGSNGFATAGLILGILPTGIFGLVFSILGLVRAPKVGGVGRTRAWIGLVLSVLYIIGGGVFIVAAASSGVKQAVTCNQTEKSFETLATKIQNDSSDKNAEIADFNQAISLLNSGASKVSDAKSASDMRKLAADFKELVNDVNTGTAPSSDLTTRLTADGNAVDADCS
ncbi:MAG TPA: hypothetical protein VGF84_22045 [Micromonosporaceae bacterium]